MPTEISRLTPLLGICFAMLCASFAQDAHAEPEPLELGVLPTEKCIDTVLQTENEMAEENQRYWYARVPPYIGYKRGESTTAGGDGTCYLGFPKGKSTSAIVMVGSRVIQVIPQKPDKGNAITTYKSKDRQTTVVVKITGHETTCVPDEGTCCGDYTYATIKVIQGKKKITVKAARYEGS